MSNLFDIKDYVVVITGGTGVLGKLSPSIWLSREPKLPFWDVKKK